MAHLQGTEEQPLPCRSVYLRWKCLHFPVLSGPVPPKSPGREPRHGWLLWHLCVFRNKVHPLLGVGSAGAQVRKQVAPLGGEKFLLLCLGVVLHRAHNLATGRKAGF